MNLQQLILSSDPQGIVDAHNSHYADGQVGQMSLGWLTGVLLPLVQAKTLVDQPGSKMVLDHHRLEYDDPTDNETYFRVTHEDAHGKTWSSSFVPWDEQLAAHMIWELTWHGLEDEAMTKGQKLNESSKKSQEDFQTHEEDIMVGLADPNTLPEGYSSFEDIFGEQTPEEEAKLKAHMENFQTVREWKNGQPIGPNHS
jgi:hypothetical protein